MQWCLTLFLFSVVATGSWITQLIVGGDNAFAVVSNVAFAIDVLLVPFVAQRFLVDSHPMTYATTILSALLAAASFAHHTDRTMSPAHALDIAMTWVVYLHLCVYVVYTMLQRVVSWPRLLLVTTLAECMCLILMFTFYSTVKEYQVVVLVVFGVVTHSCSFAHHVYVSGRAGLLSASLNIAAVVVLQVVATTLQGQIWYRSLSPARYNIEHGYWHLLNGAIIGIVVTQTTRLLSNTAPSSTVLVERVCCVGLVGFAAILMAVTLLNKGDEVLYPVMVPTQLVLLFVPGAALRRRWLRSPRATTANDASQTPDVLAHSVVPHAAAPH